MMKWNEKEALECLEIAKKSIVYDDRARILELLSHACRLDPSVNIDPFLCILESENKNPNQTTHGNPSNSYTDDQVAVVQEIKKKKCFYEILGLEKNCSAKAIGEAYMKLSLEVHPKKNNAPGAGEAFNMVFEAFQCLSDKESRKTYDLVFKSGGVNRRMHTATNCDWDEFPFEYRQEGMSSRLKTLLFLLPYFMLWSIPYIPFSDVPVYSFSMSPSYNHHYTTQKGVDFYVGSASFEKQHPPNSPERIAIEEQVHRDYHSYLFLLCRHERIYLEAPNCDALKRFRLAMSNELDEKVSLLTENGNTKDDLKLSTNDNLLTQIKDGSAEGKDHVVGVMPVMGEEQICALKDGAIPSLPTKEAVQQIMKEDVSE